MTAREIKKALRDGTHVICKLPTRKHGFRVMDVRTVSGFLQVQDSAGSWWFAAHHTVYEMR